MSRDQQSVAIASSKWRPWRRDDPAREPGPLDQDHLRAVPSCGQRRTQSSTTAATNQHVGFHCLFLRQPIAGMKNEKWRMKNAKCRRTHFSFSISHFPLSQHFSPRPANADTTTRRPHRLRSPGAAGHRARRRNRPTPSGRRCLPRWTACARPGLSNREPLRPGSDADSRAKRRLC